MMVLAGCSKDENVSDEAPAMQTITLSCNIADDPATRAIFSVPATGNIQPTWEASDVIGVVATDGKCYKFTMVDGSLSADSKSASFTGEIPSDKSAYYALYPWIDGLESSSDPTGDFQTAMDNATKNQTYTENAFDKNAFALIGKFSGSSVNLGASSTNYILHLKGTATIGKIEVIFDKGEVDEEVHSCLNCGSGVALDASESKIFAISSSSKYGINKVLTFIFYDESNNPLATKTKTIVSAEKNYPGILDMPELTINAAAPATTGTTDGHDWVQLWADGPKFATMNVGATITDYASVTATSGQYTTANVGGLYAWGTPGTDGRTSTWDSSVTTGTTDIATNKWGTNWKLPSKTDLDNLNSTDNCVWTWCDGSTTQYVTGCTLAGYKVSGKAGTDYENNSIFLPVTGVFNYAAESLASSGSAGYYWSSTEKDSDDAYTLVVISSYKNVGNISRKYGCSVRAVLSE